MEVIAFVNCRRQLPKSASLAGTGGLKNLLNSHSARKGVVVSLVVNLHFVPAMSKGSRHVCTREEQIAIKRLQNHSWAGPVPG